MVDQNSQSAQSAQTPSLSQSLSPRDIAITAQLTELDLSTYCNKTGKPCGFLSTTQLTTVIRTHGIERLLTILPQLRMTLAPEWIFTDDCGLQQLANYEPREYLVYAIFNLLPRLEEQTIPQMQADFEKRIKCWENLQSYTMEMITTTAELCRRLLAKNRPACLSAILLPLSPCHITANHENLSEFIALMQTCLVEIKSGYYEKAAIDARDKALEQYRLQKQLKFLTDLEIAINQEFDDFDIFKEHSAAFIEASSKRQARLTLQQEMQVRKAKREKVKKDGNVFTSKTVINPIFKKLKLGGSK